MTHSARYSLPPIWTVCFVQDYPDLVIVSSQSLNRPPELVTDVQLVSIKEQKNSVHSFSKPLQYSNKIIASVCPLLFSTENPRSVHDRDPLQHLRVCTRTLKPIEESIAKLGERSKLFLRVHH